MFPVYVLNSWSEDILTCRACGCHVTNAQHHLLGTHVTTTFGRI